MDSARESAMESVTTPTIQALIQNAIKTVEGLTELDRRLVPREILEELEAKLMVAEAKIAAQSVKIVALQADLDAKEDERQLYYDKFKQYGRENRDLKKKLSQSESNSESPRPQKKAKKIAQSSRSDKSTVTVSTGSSTSQKSISKAASKKKRRSKSLSKASANHSAETYQDDSSSSWSPRKKPRQLFDLSPSSTSDSEDSPPVLRPEVKIEEISNSNSSENCPSTTKLKVTTNLVESQNSSKPNGFVCQLCEPRFRPAPFKTIEHYRIHIKHVHFIGSNEQPYFCRYCPYHSAKKSDVKRHESIHAVSANEPNHTCYTCFVHFTNQKSLSKHLNTYHP